MSRKVRVCHFTTVHPSGDTRIFVKEATTLAAAGYDVSLIAVNTDEKELNGVKISSLSSGLSGRIFRMFITSRRMIKAAAALNADIYHFHDPELLPYIGKLLGKGKKVIYDVHEDLPRQLLAKYYIPDFLRIPLSKLVEWIENYYSGKVSAIVTATPFIRDRFLKHNSQTIDVCNFPEINELTLIKSYSERPGGLCYIGSITRERGLMEMIRAMEGLPYRLHLCGEFYPSSLKHEAMQLPGWNQVVEHGYVDRASAMDILGQSRIGLVTLHPIINYLDAYPVKMFEYMMAGIPVIASDIPLWKGIIERSDCGICVDPLNPDDIRRAICFLMENPQRADVMGRNGREAVTESYHWGLEREKLLSIYHKLTES